MAIDHMILFTASEKEVNTVEVRVFVGIMNIFWK